MPLVFVPVPDCVQVQMRFTEQGQKVENVFHVQTPAPATVAQLTEIADLFRGLWNDNIRLGVSQELSLNTIACRALDAVDAPSIENAIGMPLVGADTAQASPMNVTIAIKWLTNRTGRSYRGRTFHLGLVNAQLLDSRMVATSITYWTNSYSSFLAGTISAGYPMVVASRVANKLPRTIGVKTLITSCSIDPILDSQRRRLPGRGS